MKTSRDVARRTVAERQAQRQRYRDAALARAALTGLTFRCQQLAGDPDSPDHRLCRGESRGGAGCLCRCHDVSIATTIEEVS